VRFYLALREPFFIGSVNRRDQAATRFEYFGIACDRARSVHEIKNSVNTVGWLFLRGLFATSKPPSILGGTPAMKRSCTDFEKNSTVTGGVLPRPTKQREAAFCLPIRD
jgi:hypothetical protein